MKKYKRNLITCALPYANGPVHIGHLAGVYIPADIYVRYLRLKGEDVIWVCGSDEHGVPITLKAKNEGITPQKVVDKYHNIIKKSFIDFGITFDIYSRTSAKVHHETATEFFKNLYDKGSFNEKLSNQLYDEKANQFLADRYVTGTCPHCGNESAYGDQCEKCGTSLSANDLINPKSAITGNIPIMKETKHWYLPLNEYSEFFEKWILEDHKEWKTNVYGQCKSWIKDIGLEPRAVTRDLDWGVPVPIEGVDDKVLYVWFDAPIGYISATKELTNDWEKYWKNDDTRLIHFIGKDNIVFHCIIFPAMLKAEGSYILPDNVPANEFLNLEGDKISTSRNWAVWLHEYLEEFPDKQDVLRYVLTATAPETKDNDFTWKDFQTRNNSELVAVLGNFVNRTLVLTQKYFNGEVPNISSLNKEDQAKIEKDLLERKYTMNAIEMEVGQVVKLGNIYLARVDKQEDIYEMNSQLVKPKQNPNPTCYLVTQILPQAKGHLPFDEGDVLEAEMYEYFKPAIMQTIQVDLTNYVAWLESPMVRVLSIGGEDIQIFSPAAEASKKEGFYIEAENEFSIQGRGVQNAYLAAGNYVVVFHPLFLDMLDAETADPQDLFSKHIANLTQEYSNSSNSADINADTAGIKSLNLKSLFFA